MPETNEQVEKTTVENSNGDTPQDFTAWLESQDDTVRELYAEHTAGLQEALKSERETRKGLERQLRDAAAKAEAGSDAQKQLAEAAARAETANRQADFYEAAHAQGVTDLRLAWLAVADDEALQRSDGSIDYEALRAKHPSLFASTRAGVPQANAGAGSGTQGQPSPKSMNDIIRDAAMRR